MNQHHQNSETKQYISKVNSHIEDYLDYFCDLEKAPQFAILLKGEWGSGKSWFINKYKEKLEKKEKEKSDQEDQKKTIYISLYGVSNFSQVENIIFQQTHPLFASKPAIIAGKILNSLAFKVGIGLDINSDGKSDTNLSSSSPQINIKDFLNPAIQDDSKYNLVIFDDLERCSLETETILGYINTFVTSDCLKVVIIANENEIKRRQTEYTSSEDEVEQRDKSYQRKKEKVIGKTFDIVPDFSSALDDFINEIQDEIIREKLRANNEIITDFFAKGKCKNLRILRQIILDWVRIFNAVPANEKDNLELIRDILKTLIFFSIEVSLGKLDTKKISAIPNRIEKELIENLQNRRETLSSSNSVNQKDKVQIRKKITTQSFQDMLRKYDLLSNYYEYRQLFPSWLWWETFFDKGIVDNLFLEESIKTSRYSSEQQIEAWIQLYHYDKYTDEEFDHLLKTVDLEYKQNKFTEVCVIQHIVGLFLLFSDAELYEKDKATILKESQDYIDDLERNNRLHYQTYFKDKSTEISFRNKSYMGLTFKSQEVAEFQELDNYILECHQEIRERNLPTEIEELLKILVKDTSTFCSMICQRISSSHTFEHPEISYIDFPIFSYFSDAQIQDFLQSVCQLPRELVFLVFASLKKRYEIQGYTDELLKEKHFLSTLQKLLLQEAQNRKGKLSSYTLKQVNKYHLSQTVDIVEETECQRQIKIIFDNSNNLTKVEEVNQIITVLAEGKIKNLNRVSDICQGLRSILDEVEIENLDPESINTFNNYINSTSMHQEALEQYKSLKLERIGE